MSTNNNPPVLPSEPPPPYINPEEGMEGAHESRVAQQAGESAAFLSALSGRRQHSNPTATTPSRDHEPDAGDLESLLSETGSEDSDLYHAPSHRTHMGVSDVRREMEQFEIYDPAAETVNRGPSFTSRAAIATQQLAYNVNSKIITPVSRMLDPVAQLINKVSRRFDALISRFGNPLILKRLLYLFFVFLIIYVSFESGILPGSAKDAFGGGEYYDRDSLMTFLRDTIDSNVIKERVRYLSSMPHQAGTSGDLTLARYVQEQLKGYGMEPVELSEHNAYLTYPNQTAGSFELLDGDKVVYSASMVEDSMYSGDSSQIHQQPIPYHAFSKAGTAEGPLIYVNYGTRGDLEYLKSQNIELKGAVFVARMGRLNLGLKTRLASDYGAVGLVTFSNSYEGDQAWPEGPGYPDGAIERASASIPEIIPGDILTPGWSSFSKHRFTDPSNVKILPTIPVMPSSWRDIKPFLEAIKGHGIKTHKNWVAANPAGLGEWWSGSGDGPRARISTSPIVKTRHAIWNVFGKISGVEQGELAIVIGAKRDSWCYGAVESASGTAVLLELARIFSHMASKLDWVPLRSIYFASWDANNHNYAGSTEWVELNVDELKRNGALYISLDEAVSGTHFTAQGHPLVERVLAEVLQQVKDPATNTTIGSQNSAHALKPFREPGDYLSFQSNVGMASFQIGFTGRRYPKNSCFDSYEWLERFADTEDFAYHRTATDIAARLALRFADDPILPFDVSAYSRYISWYVDDLQKYVDAQGGHDAINLEPLRQSIHQVKAAGDKFDAWCEGWKTAVNSAGEPPIFSVHRWSWNSHLVGIDKHLLDSNGVPGRPWYKHVVFGPQMWHPTESNELTYAWGTFPAVRDFAEAKDWAGAQEAVNRAATIINVTAKKLSM